jgi:hypothetical protein
MWTRQSALGMDEGPSGPNATYGSTMDPTEWLLWPQFRLWPPPRHRAVSWTLATFVEFRSQRGALLALSDLHDFFQRAKRKLYQSRNRMRLVGNYLDVLEL